MSQKKNFTKKKCVECKQFLGHFPCDVSIIFIIESNVGSDGLISAPTSITLNNNGHHDHSRCSVINRRNNTVSQSSSSTSDPYFNKLVPNFQNSCFIDAVIEMLFRSVLPFFSIKQLFDQTNNNDMYLRTAFTSFQERSVDDRQLAFTTMRAYFRRHSIYKGTCQGTAGEAFLSAMETFSNQFQDLFKITGIVSHVECENMHVFPDFKHFRVVINIDNPLKVLSSKIHRKCKEVGCNADAVLKQLTEIDLPKFIFFENRIPNRSQTIFPYHINYQGNNYYKHAVVYFNPDVGHYYVRTKILHNGTVFVVEIDNLKAELEHLTSDPSSFEEKLNKPKDYQHYDSAICYKKQ
jgi:hypothetical protein